MTEENSSSTKSCFVMMPISDVPGYEPGHFRRVYDLLIKPACIKAGFEPTLASDVATTNVIMIDILKRIYEADMAICDLSSRNPNALYELGIRHSFNRPVTLITDDKTNRIFDVGMTRDITYDSTLRIDKVTEAIDLIASAMKATYENKDKEINSVLQLMGIRPAELSETNVSKDTELILDAIKSIGDRVSRIESPVSVDINSINNRNFNRTRNLTLYFNSDVSEEQMSAAFTLIEQLSGSTLAARPLVITNESKGVSVVNIALVAPINLNQLNIIQDTLRNQDLNFISLTF